MSSKPEAVITRVRASNFRSIESLDLQFDPLNVLVGQNGAGKSNIIDVLRFVRDCINRSVDQALLDRGGMSAVRRLSPRSPGADVAIELECTVGRIAVEYGFSLGSDGRSEYLVREEHLRTRDTATGYRSLDIRLNCGRWAEKESGTLMLQDSYSEFDLHLPKGWMLHSGMTKHADVVAIVDATRLFTEMSFYNISPESLRPPQQIVAESPFDEKGRNLAAVLRRLRKGNGPELNDIEGALARLVDGLRTYEIHNVGSYLITKLLYEFPNAVSEDATRLGSDLAHESDGTLRILSILAALYQQPSRPLVVIEEPETNIHPGALGVIADLLKEASLRSQILVTTHNPDLIEHFAPDMLRVVEKSDGVTHAGPVAHDQQEAIRKMLFSTAEIMKMEGLRRETAGV
jgi:predicted ATPase